MRDGIDPALQHADVKAAQDRIHTIPPISRVTRLSVFLFAAVALGMPLASASTSVELEWTPPPGNTDGTVLNDLAGYKVYYGTVSGAYTQSVDVGNTNSVRLVGLQWDTTYFSAVKAYNHEGIESGFSEEIQWLSPAPRDGDADTLPDYWETSFFGSTNAVDGAPGGDPDGDGLSNYGEFVAGSSPVDGSSCPRVGIGDSDNGQAVQFTALEATGPGYEGLRRYYSLVTCADVQKGVWLPVPGYESILAGGQTVRYAVDASRPAGYYRTRVWLE